MIYAANKFENLNEMDTFLERQKKALNRSVNMKNI